MRNNFSTPFEILEIPTVWEDCALQCGCHAVCVCTVVHSGTAGIRGPKWGFFIRRGIRSSCHSEGSSGGSASSPCWSPGPSDPEPACEADAPGWIRGLKVEGYMKTVQNPN